MYFGLCVYYYDICFMVLEQMFYVCVILEKYMYIFFYLGKFEKYVMEFEILYLYNVEICVCILFI